MTPPTAEDLLALHLDELGCYYHRQYEYAKPRRLRADFAIWNRKAKNWRSRGMDVTTRLGLVEVQGGIYRKGGAAHSSIAGIKRDIDRAQQACLNGWFWLPVTVAQVESGEAKEMVRKWLES